MDMKSKIIRMPFGASVFSETDRPVVFTNGVFDVLHPGHVTYLEQAKRMGVSLLVGINSDFSARMLGKGPDRPINNENDRALMIAALDSVDRVMIFDQQTPCELIKQLRPEIYVKGGDYDMGTLEEARLVTSWGGIAKALPFLDGYSTTKIVSRIRTND
jgi:rfaE bifunctional protein nucleotidyltransferase chain/domain